MHFYDFLFSLQGKVDKGLLKVLEKLCDEKSDHLELWHNRVLSRLSVSADESMDVSGDADPFDEEDDKDDRGLNANLLGAWKAFLIILTRDQPVTLSPVQCRMLSTGLIKGLRKQLKKEGGESAKVTTSLSEMSLVLMRR